MIVGILFSIDKNGGYAKKGSIPWKNSQDLKFFKQHTMNHIVIMGRKTWDSLGQKPLPDRINIVISKTLSAKDSFLLFHALSDALAYSLTLEKNIYIIGGKDLLLESLPWVNTIYLTKHDQSYDCDQSLELSFLDSFALKTTIPLNEYSRVEHYVCDTDEWKYLELLRKILENGNDRSDRTGVGTRSLFGEFIDFNLQKGIPLLTTKKMAWKTCIQELLWFLRGDTDSKILEKKKVCIWKPNSTRDFLDKRGLMHYREGDVGPLYGFAWKHFGAEYKTCDDDYEGQGFDQISYIENEIKTNPESRRIMMSAWNPNDFSKCAILPCHVSAQFYVQEGFLSCHVYMRSADCFLGLPFNIFSYSVLTLILCEKCSLLPGRLCISIGDAHVYKNHFEQIEKQLGRLPFSFPTLKWKPVTETRDWSLLQIHDFHLSDYFHHSSIQASMNP